MQVYIIMHAGLSVGGRSVHDCTEINGVYDSLEKAKSAYIKIIEGRDFTSNLKMGYRLSDFDPIEANFDIWAAEDRWWIETKTVS